MKPNRRLNAAGLIAPAEISYAPRNISVTYMLPQYQTSLLNHFKVVAEWVTGNGATATISVPGCVLRVQHNNRVIDFQPQFRKTSADGTPRVWMTIQPESSGFFGWLPYFNKIWDAARSKSAFKALADRVGVCVPRLGIGPDDFDIFLIKSELSSFGEGIHGPFRRGSPTPMPLGDGQFIEEFIEGRILKALYWNAQLVAVENYSPATVKGDGHSTVAELISTRPKFSARPINFDIVSSVLGLHGLALNAVPARGEAVIVDYRYGSALFDLAMKNTNSIATLPGAVVEQLAEAGKRLEVAVPDAIRDNTAFSLDGVLDDAGRVWFLEMNCNPHLHPDIYPAMLESLFEKDDLIPDDLKPLHLRKSPGF